jgi:seryl-tRNA synthetase
VSLAALLPGMAATAASKRCSVCFKWQCNQTSIRYKTQADRSCIPSIQTYTPAHTRTWMLHPSFQSE